MRRQQFAWPAARIMTALLLAVPGLMAQAEDADRGELSVFTGGTFGAGSHGAVGGSAGAAITRYGMLLLEGAYMPLGDHTIQPWPAESTVQRSHLWDIALDTHIRIPVKERWEPYAILGTGILWNTVEQGTVNQQGAATIHKFDQFNGAFHTGGGVRFFIGKNWGIRPEVKAIVTRQTYTRVSVGIFYVTSGQWP
jgi:hypothetical protein